MQQWKALRGLCVLCVLSLAVMTAALVCTAPAKAPAFTPPPFEANAVPGLPEVPEELFWQELDAQAFRFSVCGALSLKGSQADVWLTNPDSSSVWLKLRVLDASGAILGQTGLLKPGEYVRSVALTAIPAPSETITLKLMAYEPETYFSAGSVTLTAKLLGGDTK